MLNSKQLLSREIITGPIDNDMIQQIGIDLRVIKISRTFGGGVIPFTGKTTLGPEEMVATGTSKDLDVESDNASWILTPGVYRVEFEQGCDIPADVVLFIRQRSSLLRNGTILCSSVFDPGFRTKSIGTVLIVNAPIAIQYKARIGQIYGFACTPVDPEDLYDGQFQQDKQRG